MADYTEFTLAQTAFKFGVGQDWTRQLRDNFINHEDRIKGIEFNSLVFDHFNLDNSEELLPEAWLKLGNVAAGDQTYPAFSVLRLRKDTGLVIGFVSKRNFRFDEVTLPLIFKTRIKKLVDVDIRIGLRLFFQGTTGLPADAAGIWLERVDATDFRFVSFDTSRQNGVPFAKPTDNVWFDMEIEFTDMPSNKALCRIDGTLKETILLQLPTTKILHGLMVTAGSGGAPGVNVLDIDRARVSSAGMADAP